VVVVTIKTCLLNENFFPSNVSSPEPCVQAGTLRVSCCHSSQLLIFNHQFSIWNCSFNRHAPKIKILSFPATSPLLSLVCRQGRCVLLIVTLLLCNTQRPHQLCTNLQQHLLGDVAGKKGRCVLLIVTLLLRNTQRPHQLCTNLQQHLLGDVAGKEC
jgi:hypothetical protein